MLTLKCRFHLCFVRPLWHYSSLLSLLACYWSTTVVLLWWSGSRPASSKPGLAEMPRRTRGRIGSWRVEEGVYGGGGGVEMPQSKENLGEITTGLLVVSPSGDVGAIQKSWWVFPHLPSICPSHSPEQGLHSVDDVSQVKGEWHALVIHSPKGPVHGGLLRG